MRLINLNVEIVTDDEKEIRELKEKGYIEVKDAGKPKSKSNRKVKKPDTE